MESPNGVTSCVSCHKVSRFGCSRASARLICREKRGSTHCARRRAAASAGDCGLDFGSFFFLLQKQHIMKMTAVTKTCIHRKRTRGEDAGEQERLPR